MIIYGNTIVSKNDTLIYNYLRMLNYTHTLIAKKAFNTITINTVGRYFCDSVTKYDIERISNFKEVINCINNENNISNNR